MLNLVLRQTLVVLQLGIAGMFAAFAMFLATWLYLAPTLPGVAQLRDISLQTPLRVYSREGLLIGEFGEQRRIPLEYEDIPPALVHALLAAEDDRFLSHPGVDLAGLLRAFIEFLRSGNFRSGGSTITMQVARNYFLSQERTLARKINEILLALRIEKELSKQEIFSLYANKIYLGNRAYGVAVAALVYYGKDLDALSLAQYAMIAGLPKAPSTFNPLVNPQRAVARRNWILQRMHSLGYIERAQLREAQAAPIEARYHSAPIELEAPYVAEMVRRLMIQRYGLKAYTAGYRVFTTVEEQLQRAARAALVDGLVAYDWRHGWRGAERRLGGATGDGPVTEGDIAAWRRELGAIPALGGLAPAVVLEVREQSFSAALPGGERVRIDWEQGLSEARAYLSEDRLGPEPQNAAQLVQPGDVVRLRRAPGTREWQLRQLPEIEGGLVALNPGDGAIRSLVGGFDFQHNKFNHVTQGRRQPGSGLKPFIYAAGLESGMTAATIFNDAPVVFEDEKLEDIWRPSNVEGRFNGPMRLRAALYQSRNLVSVRLLRQLGIDNALDAMGRFGFDISEAEHNLSLALGSHALRPMELAVGYAVFANGGYRVAPYVIERVEDLEGGVLEVATPPRVPPECMFSNCTEEQGGGLTPPRVIERRVAYIMETILRDVILRGTGRPARALERGDLAGKTGTTNGPTDAWFSGYSLHTVATVWLGFDQNQFLGQREYGGSAALPVWVDFMQTALQGVSEQSREQPDGMVVARIDPDTGEPASPGQAGAIFEIFRREHAPVAPASAHTAPVAKPDEKNAGAEAINDLF